MVARKLGVYELQLESRAVNLQCLWRFVPPPALQPPLAPLLAVTGLAVAVGGYHQ